MMERITRQGATEERASFGRKTTQTWEGYPSCLRGNLIIVTKVGMKMKIDELLRRLNANLINSDVNLMISY